MQSSDFPSRRSDGHLWVMALGLSLLVNAAILATVGLAVLETARLRQRSRPPQTAPVTPSVALIYPQEAATARQQPTTADKVMAPPAMAAVAAKERFTRTSEDQRATTRPEHPAFMGERNTQATSDRVPDPTAPPLPSQAGITPKNDEAVETTNSSYQDGSLTPNPHSSPIAPDSPPAPPPIPQTIASAADPHEPELTATAIPPAGEPDDLTEQLPAATPPPPREPGLAGPHPVDVPVPSPTPMKQVPRESRPTGPPDELKPPPRATADTPKPTPAPAFKGFQRKTAIVGSISRTGRSALDVEDSPLGRYQAALSRAVELEWQRNCVRHRDYITPGFLTVRFFVEPGGKVRSVQFVGDMETGEVQKGFTLNSIRDAAIPPMPASLRKEFNKEPLELIFRFYF